MRVMVSVLCVAYNHEKYIRKCLDGFIMQRTSFPFEVIVHDDASTDNTAAIIKEYEKKYPEIIKPIYQRENQLSQGKFISGNIMLSIAKGKYLAICEGDDYWVDPDKLQKQYEIMESRPSCSICVHSTQCVTENGELCSNKYPHVELSDGEIESHQFLEFALDYNFQTSSYFFRYEDFYSLFYPLKEFRRVAIVGDIPMLMQFANCGNGYFFSDIMSHYRMDSIGSWGQRYSNLSIDEKADKKMHTAQMFLEFDRYSGYKFHDLCDKYYLMQLFDIERMKSNFKGMLDPRYRFLVKNYSAKARLLLFLNAYFPLLAKRKKRI